MKNYSSYNLNRRYYEMDTNSTRLLNMMGFLIRGTLFVMLLFLLSAGGAFSYGMLKGIMESSPEITSIHIGPTSYASKVYDSEGNVIATLIQEGSNRERVTFSQLPENLINAFVAIEDERFWEHNGIDPRSILRAAKGVLTSDSSAGGGSTITQQLLKNNVFEGGLDEGKFEKYVRKFQEQYLAMELENQPDMDKRTVKESILTEYLNTINLGANTLGVKVAAKRYFDKDIKDLTLSECAVIASITKNPSALNPITHPEKNNERRLQVLKNMLTQGYITESEYQDAKADDVYSRIKDVDIQTRNEEKPYSYFVDELIEQVIEDFENVLGLTEKEAKDRLYSGGLSIYATQDPSIQNIVDEEVNDPSNYEVTRYSLEWRLTVKHEDGSTVNYSEKDLSRYIKEALGKNFSGLFNTKESAEEYIDRFKSELIGSTDTILGERTDFILEPQLSFVLLDQHTGYVRAISGGRGDKKYSLGLNRATNTLRQPGSTFKVLSSFAPAIDVYGATLATPFYDSEYTLGDKTFKNWYSSGFLGYQTIRDGIIYSLNIVAVRCLMERLDPHKGRLYCENLGITTLTEEDENAALALGGITNGVSNLELTQAFSAIANGGNLNKARFYTKILDSEDNTVLDFEGEEAKPVMQETTAFLLTDAMKESMLSNRAYAQSLAVNSTSTRAHFSGMSLAGKSGTTSNNNDIWFVGFSPYYTAGVWGGCDENQSLNDTKTGQNNGGTGFHKDVWRKIMQRVHEGLPDIGFQQPEGIVSVPVCRKSGLLPTEGCSLDYRGSSVKNEYFQSGTEPTDYCNVHTDWGAINIPEIYAGLSTDDHYFSDPNEESEDAGEDGGESELSEYLGIRDSSEKETEPEIEVYPGELMPSEIERGTVIARIPV